jgi:hypothetical protein
VSIDAIPASSKGGIVAGQIHSLGPYVLLIQLSGNKLYIKAGDQTVAVLDEDYRLGRKFTYSLVVSSGVITVDYNGKPAATWPTNCTCYFKIGSYLQHRPYASREYGQVTVYGFTYTESN